MRGVASPIPAGERFHALDVLRGAAVLGILVMNIQSFAMPFAAYFNPTALGDRGALDFAIWTVGHLFFDQKFMTIFSILFGAGIVIMTRRAEERGARPAALHYRRMAWLLVFGLLHAYLIWYGDILVLYAVCGMLVYPLRRRSPALLFALGLLVLSVASLAMVAASFGIAQGPPEAAQDIRDFWSPSPAKLQAEIAAFRGGWLAQMPARAAYAVDFHTFEMWIWGIWRAGGLMLVGMALFKWRTITGERSPRFYTRVAMLGFLLGLPLIAIGVVLMNRTGWEALYSFFVGGQGNYWGSLLVSSAWMALFIRMWQSGRPRALVSRLAAVGRTAFSGYILTSIICTTIFYGHGLGLFASVGRPGQWLVTVLVWAILLVAAPAWLARASMGPLEWLWRRLTYGRLPASAGVAPIEPSPAS